MITVRDAVPTDASAIYSDCWARGWRYAYDHILPAHLIAQTVNSDMVASRIASYPDWLSASNSRGEINLVACVGTRVVGNCTGGASRSPDIADFEMYSIYLNPDYIGHGIGRTLFDEFKRHAVNRGAKSFFCECFSENKSIEFYKHMGGRVLREYDPGEKYAHHKVSIIIFSV